MSPSEHAGEALKFTLISEPGAYEIGGPVVINVTIRNDGTSPKPVVVRPPWASFVVVVRTPGGEIPQAERAADVIDASEMGQCGIFEIEPGAELTAELDLADGYDLEPGEYTVVLETAVPKSRGTAEFVQLRSNEIVIKAVERPND